MIERFAMRYTPGMDERVVSVYLPGGYVGSEARYPVMYMFDGQNAFDDEKAYYGQSWRLEEFLDGWEKPMMVVAVQSSAERDRRLAEYCPFHLAPKIWDGLRGHGRETMEWITGELKPYIDTVYRTIPRRECTGVMGASMGGLMSLYAATAYGEVFSKAGCLSPALQLCYPQMMRQIRESDISPDTRIYLSWGECEAKDRKTLTHMTARHLKLANAVIAHGARAYPFLQEEGRHCEQDWRRLVPDCMRFLWME
ncbi:MAG: alpha/beta hydrolase [Clostridia bacterium]|nr:alpha/beta hydrolase [Clostridia bacterium]